MTGTFYLGVTDWDWFQFLAQQQPDEVNFWRPSAASFNVLNPGEPFLFKLKSPHNAITGGGFFVRSSTLPLSLAWDAFGAKNGVATYPELREKILGYRARFGNEGGDPSIGCIILTEPFFFEQDAWITQPSSWSGSIVQGKSYTLKSQDGQAIWRAVRERLNAQQIQRIVEEADADYEKHVLVTDERYQLHQTRHRLGQGAFRALVTDAYRRRCAISGEKTLPVLQAAHIKPYAASGPHDTRNGLLMRSDMHILFDRGYLTVTPDYRVEVSRRIREEYKNGREYYAWHGQRIRLPKRERDRPSEDYIRWHNDNVFLKGDYG